MSGTAMMSSVNCKNISIEKWKMYWHGSKVAFYSSFLYSPVFKMGNFHYSRLKFSATQDVNFFFFFLINRSNSAIFKKIYIIIIYTDTLFRNRYIYCLIITPVCYRLDFPRIRTSVLSWSDDGCCAPYVNCRY